MERIAAGRPCDERLIEKADHRHHPSHQRDRLSVVARAHGERGREVAAEEILFQLQKLSGRVVGGEAARHAAERLALDGPGASPERRRLVDRTEAAEVRGKMLANGLQVCRLRAVHASKHHGPGRTNLKVQARSAMLRKLAVGQQAANLGLERRLVLAEAGVPVDPEKRGAGRGLEFRGEGREIHREALDERQHPGLHLAFVLVPVRVEPLAVVVPLERPQERQRLRRKPGNGRRLRRHATSLARPTSKCPGSPPRPRHAAAAAAPGR